MRRTGLRDRPVHVQPLGDVLPAHTRGVRASGAPRLIVARTIEEVPDALAREARRVARAERRRDREAGLIEKGVPIGPAEQSEFLPQPTAVGELDEQEPAPEE